MSVNTLRFGILVPQDAPLPTLADRWRRAEKLGFDSLYVADHSRDYRDANGYWFDGWTVLASMAAATSTIRIGTLVTNPILRPPAMVAKAAMTIDHLSEGRLELGIGTGIAGFDHEAIGSDYWSPAERAGRFSEYVEVIDGLLRSPGRPYSFQGRYYRTGGMPMVPAPVQQPRPPITVGGQSPTVLRVAAERADCWNTHGPFGLTADQILELTRRQNDQLEDLCVSRGRDPRTLRRSLLMFGALDAWASPNAFETLVSRFRGAGVGEFVVFWPEAHQVKLFERVATQVIPALRQAGI